jgi:hypothetical protein
MDNDKAITSGDDGGQGDALDLTKRQDRVMMRSAITQRWAIDTKRRDLYLAKLDAAIEKAEKPRDIASVVNTLLSMEAQNQADEHAAEKNKRLDEGLPTDNVVIRVPPPRTFKEAGNG